MVREAAPAGLRPTARMEKDPMIQPFLESYVAISVLATTAYLAWGFARAKTATA